MRTTHRLMAVAVSSLSLAAAAQDNPSSLTGDQQPSSAGVYDVPPAKDSSAARTSSAFAVENPDTMPMGRMDQRDRPSLMKRVGLALDVGGGVHDFVDRGHRGLVSAGAGWAARLTVGTRRHLAGEVAYVGSANAVKNALGAADHAILISNGVEGLVRVNVLVNDWQPYAVAGYTYRRYNMQNSAANTSAIADGTNSSEIPVGLGLAYRKNHFIGDLRGMVHPSVASELLPSSNGKPIAVSLAGKVGFEF